MNCPLCNQTIGTPLSGELNPNHPATIQAREMWHKLLVAYMIQLGVNEIRITEADVRKMIRTEGTNVVLRTTPDAITLNLVSDAEAERLAREAGGLVV